MLVIRTSDGEIRWMEVSTFLKRESVCKKTVKQVVFEGERFDVMSVRRWRSNPTIDSSSCVAFFCSPSPPTGNFHQFGLLRLGLFEVFQDEANADD